MTERSQPRIVASFNRQQLEEARAWWRENGGVGSGATDFDGTLSQAFEKAQFNEKGKALDSKGRFRLAAALLVITEISQQRKNIDGLRGEIKVWQASPDTSKLRVEWTRNPPSRYSPYGNKAIKLRLGTYLIHR